MPRGEALTFHNALTTSHEERSRGRNFSSSGDSDSSIPLLPTAARGLSGGIGTINLRRHFWKNAVTFSVSVGLLVAGLEATVAPPLARQLPDGALLAATFVFVTLGLVGAIGGQLLTGRFGCKRAALLATCCGLATVALALLPSYWTLVPGSAIAGLTIGSLYVAHWSYLARLSALCSDALRIGRHVVQFRVFAVAAVFHQVGQLLGQLVVSAVAGVAYHVNPEMLPKHFLRLTSVGLAGLMVAVAALVLALVVDPLSRFTVDRDERGVRWGMESPPIRDGIRLWVRMLANPNCLMLIPTALLLTGCDFFWTVDFTKTFMGDIESTVLIEVVSGTVGLLPAFLFAWYNERPCRTLPILFANFIQMAVLLALGAWHPAPNSQALSALYSSLWFFGSATRGATFLSLLVIMFPVQPEDVFATMLASSFVGRFLLLTFGTWLPLVTESAVLIALFALSLITLIAFEVRDYVINNRTLPFAGFRRQLSGAASVSGDT